MIDNQVLISFIIPAHNSAKTIVRCVDSINSIEDTSAFEIIIIENASSDNTVNVIAELQRKYTNIRMLTSPKGVSNARNTGIKQATGRWLFFIDSDDELNCPIDQLLNDALEDSSLIVYGHISGNTTKRVCIENEKFDKPRLSAACIRMLSDPTRYMLAWGKLINREVVVSNGILFDTDLRIAEDSDFVYQLIRHCDSIRFSPEIVYKYYANGDSTIRKEDPARIDDHLVALNKIMWASQIESDEIIHAVSLYILMNLNVLAVRNIFRVGGNSSFGKKIAELKNIVSKDVIRNSLRKIGVRDCLKIRMLPILMIKLRLYFAAAIIYDTRAKQNYRIQIN